MRNRTMAIAILALAPLAVAHADPDAGCGAGTKIWAGQSGTPYKLLAATTNGSFGNQTFGISSGTLGCSQNGVVTASARIPLFAKANLDQLSGDMAAGHGAALTALASLYRVANADRPAFYALTQKNYAKLFPSSATTSNDMVSTLDTLLKSDARLARYAA
ncbi:MAG: hypothetical protein B7Z66_11150 [Chromatiales bacterium 21-64-14]|nr:MAG: hypothetical protein B7Z66_11150 [Chromatiales bacterium 21-64-14]HQU16784.1 DUF3015 domain-containing protein [Gammaproteobacteria bacterium]